MLAALLIWAFLVKLKYKVQAFKSIKHCVLTMLLFFIVGVAWDHFAIYRGHWAFPGDGILGIHLGLMPLEEYLFIIVVPFWGTVMYRAIEKALGVWAMRRVLEKGAKELQGTTTSEGEK
ncbi:MAG: lycopene cyclase domain-containing protein [Desulfobacterales bacterium]|nr:lycopene cyclase domain-containing protein [Desulfobacterales bacterium]